MHTFILCLLVVPQSLQRVLKLMMEPDVNKRPEVTEILKLPEVRKHWWRRYWTLTSARIKRKLNTLSRLWQAFLSFLTSLIFFTRKKDGSDKSSSVMEFRATPEPYPVERQVPTVPDLLLNDTSFSDSKCH